MPGSAPTFIEYLEAFNRKERFFVVAAATGTGSPGGASFRLAADFRKELGEAVGLEIPPDAAGFMDYHLDWLHAAGALTRAGAGWPSGAVAQPVPVRGFPVADTISTGNQEDIDFVVAFERDGTTHIVLVEAKAETGWTNSQLNSKAPRLSAIFGPEGDAIPGMKPVFCLWSPKDTLGLSYEGWPAWCRSNERHAWLELRVPPGRRAVFGSDQSGRPSSARKYWYVTTERSVLEE